MASSFVPKGREELLLRTPLTFGFSAPTDMYQPRRSSVSSERPDSSAGGSREEQRSRMKKMSRNTPHTARLSSMRDILDNPICAVEDNKGRPRPMSALSSRDLGSGYRPPGSSRYSANASKHLYAVGVVPVTYAWRDELIRKAEKAISKALGKDKSSTSRSALSSRQSSRGPPRQFDHLDDQSLLDMMCQILNTNSIPRCQEWLNNASEDEKDIVLNMIRLAALGEPEKDGLPSRPPTRDYRYVWKPQQSRRYSDPSLGEQLDLLSLNVNPRFLFSQGGGKDLSLPGIEQMQQTGGRDRGGRGGGGGGGVGGGGGGRGGGGGGGGGRHSRLRRSSSHDSTTQTDRQERDVYRSIAAESVLKEKGKGGTEQKRRRHHSSERDAKSEQVTVLPPLQPKQHTMKQSRPRSRSASGGQSVEHHIVGGRRKAEGRESSRVQYTSRWESQAHS